MDKERFKIIYSQDNQAYMICVLEDTGTGKQYLLVSQESNESNMALCPL